MSNATGSENLQILVVVVLAGIGYLLYPSGEDWMPLDLNSYGSTSIYFDRNTVSWSGNDMSLSTKSINSNGTPLTDLKWQLRGQSPQGVKIDILIDCQQHLVQATSMSIFLKEGEYSQIPMAPDDKLNLVLNSSNSYDQKFLGLCDSEPPSWHLFRYKWVRSFFPSLNSVNQRS